LRGQGKSVFVMNLGLYFNKLKTEWEEGEKAVLENIKKCDLLIIDDFGAEMTSNTENVTWRDEKIFNLIDTAYRSEKPLIISTNLKYHEDLSKCEIEKNLGSRIRDRVVDMCYPILVAGRSRRGISEKSFWESIA
uniref:ATP-binding protein n=1 Tax=uncultured Fusobacterium sp. TaxID=159267 RepID=UPI002803EB88